MTSEMNSNTATETLQATDYETRGIGLQLKFTDRWPDWQLHIGLCPAGDDNFSNVLPTSHECQGFDHLVESIYADRVDWADMTTLNELEDFVEKPAGGS